MPVKKSIVHFAILPASALFHSLTHLKTKVDTINVPVKTKGFQEAH